MSTQQVVQGDALEILRSLAPETVDACVTDPPAGISFMGRAWDGDKGGRDQWIAWLSSIMAEVLRVLRPGAHALVWAIPRTSHWTATALEDAGFEIRDVITYIHGQGFPKSMDVSKAIDRHLGAEPIDLGVPKVHGDGAAQHTTSEEARAIPSSKRCSQYLARSKSCPRPALESMSARVPYLR